jgi:hypothetical protein
MTHHRGPVSRRRRGPESLARALEDLMNTESRAPCRAAVIAALLAIWWARSSPRTA